MATRASTLTTSTTLSIETIVFIMHPSAVMTWVTFTRTNASTPLLSPPDGPYKGMGDHSAPWGWADPAVDHANGIHMVQDEHVRGRRPVLAPHVHEGVVLHPAARPRRVGEDRVREVKIQQTIEFSHIRHSPIARHAAIREAT